MNKQNKSGILQVTALGSAAGFLQAQSRSILRALAENARLPIGRNKSDTLRILNDALANRKLHLSTYLTFRTARNQNSQTDQYDASMGESQIDLLSAKVRTHRPPEITYRRPSLREIRKALP